MGCPVEGLPEALLPLTVTTGGRLRLGLPLGLDFCEVQGRLGVIFASSPGLPDLIGTLGSINLMPNLCEKVNALQGSWRLA